MAYLPRNKMDSKFTIFVGRIPKSWTSTDFVNKAQEFGRIHDYTYKGGFGFVDYNDTVVCNRAIDAFNALGFNASFKINRSRGNDSEIDVGNNEFPLWKQPASVPRLIDENALNKNIRKAVAQWNLEVSTKTSLELMLKNSPRDQSEGLDLSPNCFNCGKHTLNFCNKCGAPVCDRYCLYNAQKVHLSFCGDVLSGPDFDPMWAKNVVKKKLNVQPFTDQLQSLKILKHVSQDQLDILDEGKESNTSTIRHDDAYSQPDNNPDEHIDWSVSAVTVNGSADLVSSKSDESTGNGSEEKKHFPTDFANIEFSCVNNGTWVLIPPSHIIEKVGEVVQSGGMDSLPASNVAIDALCMAKLLNEWYRSKIIATQPNIKVRFIDYGDITDCKPDELKLIPPEIADYPGQAVQVQLMDKQKHLLNKQLLGRTFIAKIEEADEMPIITLLMETTLYDDFSQFLSGTTVVVSTVISDSGITVVRPDQTEKYKDMNRKLTDLLHELEAPAEMPMPGQIVIALFGPAKQLRRACVVEVDGDFIIVDFCDAGHRVPVRLTEIRYIPSDHFARYEIPGCLPLWPKLQQPFGNIKNSMEFWNHLIKEKIPLQIELNDKNPFVGSKLLYNGKCCSLMKLSVDAPDIVFASAEEQFPSGVAVTISCVQSHQEVSIVRCDAVTVENYTLLANDICEAFLTENPKSGLPPIDCIVGALSVDDGNYYRARILKHLDGKAIVLFVDYGAQATVPLANLRRIAKALKNKLPNGAITVKLNNIPEHALHLFKYLTQLMDSREKLVLNYGRKLSDGVDLLKESIIVNKLMDINELRVENKEALAADYSTDIHGTIKLPDGFQKLYILYWDMADLLVDGTIWLTNPSNASVSFVVGTMLQLLQQHCENAEFPAYRPDKGEKCVAYNNGEWTRASCINPEEPGHIEVHLIDKGETKVVSSSFIRAMPKFGLTEPAIACPCTVEGFKKLSTKNIRQIQALLKKDSEIYGNVKLINNKYFVTLADVDKISNQ